MCWLNLDIFNILHEPDLSYRTIILYYSFIIFIKFGGLDYFKGFVNDVIRLEDRSEWSYRSWDVKTILF